MFLQHLHSISVTVQAAQEGLGEDFIQLHGIHGTGVLAAYFERVQARIVVSLHWKVGPNSCSKRPKQDASLDNLRNRNLFISEVAAGFRDPEFNPRACPLRFARLGYK